VIPPEESAPEEPAPAAPEAAAEPIPVPAPEASPAPDIPAYPAPEPVVLRAYDLPTARGAVAFGLTLAYRASSELRRASLYIGLLTLALLGPPLVYAIEFVAHYQLVTLEAIDALGSDPGAAMAFLGVVGVVTLGLAGWFAVSVDGSLIAVALLAARESDRAFTLREATIRARQVFWRMVGGSFITLVVSLVIQLVLASILTALAGPSSGEGFLVSFVAVILVAPLGYLATGVVLGDVGPTEALKRSIRLARARPRIALVVALFTLVTAAIQTFALGAGLDLVGRFFGVLHIGVTSGGGPLVATILALLVFVMAFGSLTFTVGAIVAAPQVAAFLGLTYYVGGLDRARDLPPTAPKFRWVTRPMLALIGVVAVLSGIGIISISSAEPPAPDALVELLGTASAREASMVGRPDAVVDPIADEEGVRRGDIDVVGAEYAYLTTIPPWLLTDAFDCVRPEVACSLAGDPGSAYDDGALLVLERLGSEPSIPPHSFGEWGPVLTLAGYTPAPSDGERFAGATHVVLTEHRNGYEIVHYYGFDEGQWTEYQTYARSRWIGSDLLTLIPERDEIQTAPLLWDVYAASGDRMTDLGNINTDRPTSSDTLRKGDGSLRAFSGFPPGILFP
jgi:hypothetical protein